MNNRDDVLEYFGARDAELALYDAFESAVLERWPDTRITVHRTQVSFYNRYLFAVASLPPGGDRRRTHGVGGSGMDVLDGEVTARSTA